MTVLRPEGTGGGPGFQPSDHYTQFGETEDTWRALLDGVNNTGWKPMLLYAVA
jgi:hypothetical protein